MAEDLKSTEGLPQLTRPRGEVERFLTEQISRGWDLYHEADQIATPEDYEKWTHGVERWDAYTRDGLRSFYSTDEPATEFHAAATGRIVRRINQSDRETLDNRKEAAGRGNHVLESLKDRLDFAGQPSSETAQRGRLPTSTGRATDGGAEAKDARMVMVVHGRNELATNAMFSFLSSLGLRPIDWETAVRLAGGGSPHNLEAVRAAMARGQAVVVLFTPDDLAQLNPNLARPEEGADELEPQGQPRPNVLIECGMAFMTDPSRTILVELGPIRGASDLAGLNAVRIDNEGTNRAALRGRLEEAGCEIDDDNRYLDRGSAGDFDAVLAAMQEAGGEPKDERATAAAVPAPPDGADEGLLAKYERLQLLLDRFLEMHRDIDQPITADTLQRFANDPALDMVWAAGTMNELEAAGRIVPNPHGEGYRVALPDRAATGGPPGS